jgi:hypothetical protein
MVPRSPPARTHLDRRKPTRRFLLVAHVSSDNVEAVGTALRELIRDGMVTREESGFYVEATMEGESARDLNRSLLSSLRRIEKRTRIRSEWTCGGIAERFFDYVPKGTRQKRHQ